MEDSYTIAGQHFASKKRLVDYVKRLLHSYKPGQTLSQPDFDFMVALLRHPPASDAADAVSMTVDKHPQRRGKHFWLRRPDGSLAEFSYQDRLTLLRRWRRFKAACAEAIARELQHLKADYFAQTDEPRCARSGQALRPNAARVDHVPPQTFEAIVADFVRHFDLDINRADIGNRPDGDVKNRFTDERLRQKFREFHQARATLEVVSINQV